MPTLALLPSGLSQRIFFILLESEPKFATFINKHVVLQGDWEWMSFPPSENIAILKVDQISEDLFLNRSPIDEEVLCYLEDRIPIMAEAAMRLARLQALASGCKVLEVERGFLIEISPDGTKIPIKQLNEP